MTAEQIEAFPMTRIETAELVAEYGAYAGIPVTMGEYEVVGEDDGQARDLGAAIAREDYGKRLLVVPVTLVKKETA